MIELLNSLNHWHWLAFGLILLASELLGTAGYLLWLGISAILVGLLLTVLPISWQLQWVSFATFSLITTWLWWRKQSQSDKQSDDNRTLNQKHKQLIGKIITVEHDITIGTNRIKVGDTTWSAVSEEEIAAHSTIKVVDVEGIVLKIEQYKK
ncbi:NfeD family protein [Vibrio sp. NTOU-M3]|uniref:NfeD family protein n=1 Tax=unclassified Vibrio TaxID=2614977 RepID=UPI00349FAE47